MHARAGRKPRLFERCQPYCWPCLAGGRFQGWRPSLEVRPWSSRSNCSRTYCSSRRRCSSLRWPARSWVIVAPSGCHALLRQTSPCASAAATAVRRTHTGGHQFGRKVALVQTLAHRRRRDVVLPCPKTRDGLRDPLCPAVGVARTTPRRRFGTGDGLSVQLCELLLDDAVPKPTLYAQWPTSTASGFAPPVSRAVRPALAVPGWLPAWMLRASQPAGAVLAGLFSPAPRLSS